jgi:hypothetical protein
MLPTIVTILPHRAGVNFTTARYDDGANEFIFVSVPPHVDGGLASPPNAVAIE